MKSKGSEKFSQIPKSGVEWAQLLGVTTASVSRWKSGLVRPDAAMRLKIQGHGGPAPQDWDLKIGTPAPPARRTKKRKAVKATPAAVIDEASLTLTHVIELRERIQSSTLDLTKEARLLADNARTLATLGKLTGVGVQLSRNAIIDSPNFRLILADIRDALAPWPEAMRALGKALDASRGS